MSWQEDAAAYMQRNALKPTFADVLDAVCKEMPEPASIVPFMLSQMCEKFPAAAKSAKIEPAQLEWTRSKTEVVDKVELVKYIEDSRFNAIAHALIERALYERPKNVPALLIELLAAGDLAEPKIAPPPGMDDDAAATKMQAVQRGRKSRKGGKKKARIEEEAVVVPQAADATGQDESREAQMAEAADEAAAAGEMSQDAAATKMQAIQRGKNSRKK